MGHEANLMESLHRLTQAELQTSVGDASRRIYAKRHTRRFDDILSICLSAMPDRSARVLDIGRGQLTARLREAYSTVTSLGFDISADNGGHRELSPLPDVPHIVFDLGQSHNAAAWPDCGPFDLIVFSEVIEHLVEAPEFVLGFLGNMLSEKGVLICTTPNAAEAWHRVAMLRGHNPFERLRLYAANPGHIREYTKRELIDIGAKVGLRCVRHAYLNWRPYHSSLRDMILRVLHLWPAFRVDQVFVYRKG